MTIRCEIVSQDHLVFEGDVDMVVVPGAGGVMGILPNHAPVLSTLDHGVIIVRSEGNEDIYTVSGGVVEVQPDIITILADASEHVDEIDLARAEEAKKRAEELLESGPPPDVDTYLAIEAALRRSNLRLEAARRYRTGRTRIPDSRDPGQGESS